MQNLNSLPDVRHGRRPVGNAASWESATTDRRQRNSPAARRKGFAVKELLLILGAIGSGIAVVKAVDPISDEAKAVAAGAMETLMECEVRLPDEFLCVVTVKRIAVPGSLEFPHYLTCLEFTGGEANSSGAFVYEFSTSEYNPWPSQARCRVWTLQSAEQALKDLDQMGIAKSILPAMSAQQRIAAYARIAPERIRAVNALADPLWHRVPPEIQDAGVLAIIDEVAVDYLDQLEGDRLSRLASAIRTAAHVENWEQADPHAFLPPTSATTISDSEQCALARSLILRLAADLPENP